MLRPPGSLPARPLAGYRILVGLVAGLKALELGASPLLGTPAGPLFGVGPVVPAAVWLALGAVMGLAALAVVVGWHGRAAVLVVGLCTAGFVWGAGYYSNHTYLLFTVAVLLSFADCDAAWSVRSWRGRGADRVWAAPVLALRAQITIVYFFAAISKIRPDFLSGNGLASWAWDSVLVPTAMLTPVVLVPLAFGAVLTELFVGFGLWSSRLRPVAVVAGIGLHLGMIGMLSDGLHAAIELGLFATLTCGGYLLFAGRVPIVDRPVGAVAVPRQRRSEPALPGTVTRR
ncbi:HTTM domain-containing protein [Pseudonocardia sp. ICBG1293]|uniref:HTTM domain-containing protein n=1 Tax=Pseudonocardia sp. ICBG1293 TaxID=2844382 RepID=UPI001CCF5BBF|nr:HTTM domain-containing protein [Pseudonocardia sp. ICBG1293]